MDSNNNPDNEANEVSDGRLTPGSDREHWGLRGAVRVCKEAHVRPTSAPAVLQIPELRIEFSREGMSVGKASENAVPLSFDPAGRKTKVRVSRPEDYVPNRSAGGSPFSIADRRPNLPEGGTATTYFDEHDRPVEAQVRNFQGEIVSSAVRIYDQMGRVAEEKFTMHDPAAPLPAAWSSLISANQQIKDWVIAQSGIYSAKFFYDPKNRVVRTLKQTFDTETEVATSYNEHGDPEVESTTSRPIAHDDREVPPSSNSEARFSYKYDQAGNWTEKTTAYRYSPEGEFKPVATIQRTLEYFDSVA